MIVIDQAAKGRVKSNLGGFIFTERIGRNTFIGVDLLDIVNVGNGHNRFAYAAPYQFEVSGEFVVDWFDQPRYVPVVVDEAYINARLEEKEKEEQTWEEYQEMLELLAQQE